MFHILFSDSMNFDHIIEALNRGIAVFCEKPVSLDIKEIDECYNTAAKLNLPLLCGKSFSSLVMRNTTTITSQQQ
jgi:predicted dehydrogenase